MKCHIVFVKCQDKERWYIHLSFFFQFSFLLLIDILCVFIILFSMFGNDCKKGQVKMCIRDSSRCYHYAAVKFNLYLRKIEHPTIIALGVLFFFQKIFSETCIIKIKPVHSVSNISNLSLIHI